MQSDLRCKKWRLHGSCPELEFLRIRVSKAKGMRSVLEVGVSFFDELRAREERKRE